MKSKIPTGNHIHNSPLGVRAMKVEDFEAKYAWELEEYHDAPKKIMSVIPFNEWYHINILCIKADLSFAAFQREALRDRVIDIKKISNRLKKKNKVTNKKTKVVNQKRHEQGSLF